MMALHTKCEGETEGLGLGGLLPLIRFLSFSHSVDFSSCSSDF